MTDRLARAASRLVVSWILGFLGGCLILPKGGLAGPWNPCEKPGNLTQNCGFDVFVPRTHGTKQLDVPEHWDPFVLQGDPDFRLSNDTYWGEPSLWLLTDGVPFVAGILQQVEVTPGVVYQADLGWAAVSAEDFERKVGLDPTGGTDPLASSVAWGRSEWGEDKWPELTVSARATGSWMTVFVWVGHPVSHGNDWVFVDAVGVWPDPSQPPATQTPTPTLTSTPRPPARTPVPSPVPETPTPPLTPLEQVAAGALEQPLTETATDQPTKTPTPHPTQAPTETALALPPTYTPLPTATLTRTPVPVVASVRRSLDAEARTHGEAVEGRRGSVSQALLYVAVGALAAATLVAILAWRVWTRERPN